MKRFYTQIFLEHFRQHKQMLFVMGPRQVGKTTTSLALKEDWGKGHYFNWDRLLDRKHILEGIEKVADIAELKVHQEIQPLMIFDEIHKFPSWKNFLKGFYDVFLKESKTLVTGSARLDVFKKGGDSLMGRYFLFRYHPLSIAEIVRPMHVSKGEYHEVPKQIDEDQFTSLLNFGGFPDPFLKNEQRFFNRWKSLRFQLFFEEEIRDLARVQEIKQLEVLAEIMRHQIGQLTSYASFAKKVCVSGPTIRHWLELLKSVYYCFEVRPYSKNISRSLIKEPKYYLWDWSFCEDPGARAENFIASHLLKAVHFWTDYGLGDYQLYYLRDKSQREVDFVITKNNHPWILIEAKNCSNKQLSPSLLYFQEQTKAPFAFQAILDMPYVNKSCFDRPGEAIIVPAKTLLSQLV